MPPAKRPRKSRPQKNRPLLITFEGTEGAGKSTLIRFVAQRLESSGLSVLTTREPGGTRVAESIRSIILEQGMNPWTELFLYEASRAEHVARVIQPALDEGTIVLCDRFTDSSLAYQSHARGLPWNAVESMNRLAAQGIKPALTVFLDIDPAIGLNRAREHTRFEAEGEAFQRKVRAGYLKARDREKSRWLVLRPKQESPEQLADQVIEAMRRKRLIPRKKSASTQPERTSLGSKNTETAAQTALK